MSNTPPPPLSLSAQPPPSPSQESLASSFVIVVIIIASAVIVSAVIYILLRFLSRRFHRSFRTFAAVDDVVPSRRDADEEAPPPPPNALLDRLPLFTFGSVTGNLTGGDCAVCLSRFEPHDQLRLLPFCCHAFHADCIDTWIVANQSCPLCRSTVLPSDEEVLTKAIAADLGGIRSGSFRVEIGSVSRRRDGAAAGDRRSRSFSIGSFDYVLDGDGHEVSVASGDRHRRGISDADKESAAGVPIPGPPGEAVAAEVSGGRNWLRDYVDRLASSRAMSFRSSGRFFSGSSRRSDVVFAAEDLEANRVGEEISELFRWLSGV